jgi:hypothetical protein
MNNNVPKPAANNQKLDALKQDCNASGFSATQKAGAAVAACPKKKWIALHILDVTDAKADPTKAKPVVGTAIHMKLPGPGDTKVISAKKPVKVNQLDDGTGSIKQIEPLGSVGWVLEAIESA